MTTRRTLTLTCDHCGAIARRYLAAGADEAAAERALRAELAAEGWSVDSGPDTCPACTAAAAPAVPEQAQADWVSADRCSACGRALTGPFAFTVTLTDSTAAIVATCEVCTAAAAVPVAYIPTEGVAR